jgi:DNA adenine methylase
MRVVLYQSSLFPNNAKSDQNDVAAFKFQLLKWIGNKQRFAHEIISFFPPKYGRYFEPFLGSGAVLGTLAPRAAFASDACAPLVEIWKLLSANPTGLLRAYKERWLLYQRHRVKAYEEIKARFNSQPNPEDLLFLSCSCYGGVIRFRKDGYMSTPIGVHKPITPESLARRIKVWRRRTAGAVFECCDFEEAIDQARHGDLIYCDPPYSDTQAILYGAQEFSLQRLYAAIERAKERGAFVALSIDGQKKSGKKVCNVPAPSGLFETEALVNCGRSMLRRFQMGGQTLESEIVADRLLLTWP